MHGTGLVAAALARLISRPSARAVLLVATVVCLAVLAGVLAGRAFAEGIDTYCNDCFLPSSGVPAVSQAQHYTFEWNELYDAADTNYYWLEVFYYHVNGGLTFCRRRLLGTDVYSDTSCGTNGYLADARCHTVNGTGNDYFNCYAEYRTN